MSKFPAVWNSAYETLPPDTELESIGAGRIRDLKVEVRERMQQDHSWNGDDSDGYHGAVTLLTQTSDPTPTPVSGTAGSLYTKIVNTINELFYRNSSGAVQQLTSGGGLFAGVPTGTVLDYAGSGSIPPAGFYFPYGQAVSRTTDAALFAVLGTTYGTGDGSTTFNLPDYRGRIGAGMDNMGGTAASRLTPLSGFNGSIDGTILGNTGGDQNMQQHSHGTTENPHNHALGNNVGGSDPRPEILANATGIGSAITANSVTGLTINNAGLGAGANLQPTIVVNKIIKR